MHLDPYILTFSALTVFATVFMGFWAARKSKTAHDFYVAGRSVSVGWNASAISGEYLSAASFMGIAGMVMSSGYDALWYPVCYACGYLFLLLFIAGPLRRFGAYTIPDFAEGRYDSPVFRKIAVVFVLFIGFFYTMPQMKGAGTTLAYIFQDLDLRGTFLQMIAPHDINGMALKGFPYWAGVVLVGAVITLNVALGGMKGITLVQAFQYWAKMFAISVPIFVLMAVYGHYGKQLEVNSAPKVNKRVTAEQFSSRGWRTSAIGGNSNKLFLAYSDFRESIDRATGKQPLLAGKRAVDSWLTELAENHGFKRFFTAESLRTPQDVFTNEISMPTFSNPVAWETGLLDSLRSNGIEVIFTSHALLVVPAGRKAEFQSVYEKNGSQVFEPNGDSDWWELQEEIGRKPLPKKAPGDSTWLNPFGPLTTKAAKAAAAALTNHTEFVGQLPLRAGLSPDRRLTVNLDENDLGLCLRVYGELTDRKVWPDTRNFGQRLDEFLNGKLSRLGIIRLKGGPGYISYHNDGLFSVAEIKQRLEQSFLRQGILLIPEGMHYFRAVHMGERLETTTAGAALQKWWLRIHERPLALLYTYSLIIALVCGTAGLPHILVRFYTNPDGVAAKRTTMWVMILIGIFYVFPPVFGAIGRNLLPELYAGVGAKGTDKIVLELPRILNERYAPLGSILSGITCAGAFAAFMSTFSGLLVSMTGALAHDVYGRMLRPKSTPDQRMRAFKICAVVIGAIAILLGMQVEPFQINFMVGQAFAIAAASYFPLLFMSAWWRGMTMKGAAAGMLTGGLLALFGISLTSFTDLKWLPLDAFWAAHPLLRILCEQPAIWAVPLAITLMIVVSKLTRREVPSDIRMKMLVLHAPEKLGLKQEYIQEHQAH